MLHRAAHLLSVYSVHCVDSVHLVSIPGASTKKFGHAPHSGPTMRDTAARVRQFLSGHRMAAQRQRELLEARGPDPKQAVAECLAVLEALEAKGLWPGPRDPVSEREAARVRELWAKVKREFRSGGAR